MPVNRSKAPIITRNPSLPVFNVIKSNKAKNRDRVGQLENGGSPHPEKVFKIIKRNNMKDAALLKGKFIS